MKAIRLAAAALALLTAFSGAASAQEGGVPIPLPAVPTLPLLPPLPPGVCAAMPSAPTVDPNAFCNALRDTIKTYNQYQAILQHTAEYRQKLITFETLPYQHQATIQGNYAQLVALVKKYQDLSGSSADAAATVDQHLPTDGSTPPLRQSLAASDALLTNSLKNTLRKENLELNGSIADMSAVEAIKQAGLTVKNPTEALQLLIQLTAIMYESEQRQLRMMSAYLDHTISFNLANAQRDQATARDSAARGAAMRQSYDAGIPGANATPTPQP